MDQIPTHSTNSDIEDKCLDGHYTSWVTWAGLNNQEFSAQHLILGPNVEPTTPVYAFSQMVEHDDSSLNPATTSPPPITTGGLIISTTDAIRSFLVAASTDGHLSEDLRDLSSSLIVHSSIPYKSLRSIWFGSEPDKRPDLSVILFGCEFLFASPKPREKGEELKARLAKLAEVAERKMYEELVKDITPRKHEVEPFSSYKDQLGFGLHVVLIMFTGYLLGYAAFRALFSHSPAMNAAGGILGLVLGMLVETLLFIVRSTSQDLGSPSSTSKMIKKNQ